MTQVPVAATSDTVAAADARLAGGDVHGAIDLLTQANRRGPSAALERALVRIRVDGCASLPAPAQPPRADLVAPIDGQDWLFEIAAADLTVSAVRAGLAQGRANHQAWLAEVFEDRLPSNPAQRRRTLAALHAATDVYTWKLLRRDQGLSRKKTAASMRRLIQGILERRTR